MGTLLKRMVILLIGLSGLMVIIIEVSGFLKDSSALHKQFSLNQKKQLELLESELESETRHLVQIFPAFVKSQELLHKINEVTLAGPYFVYSPQQYGQVIDYWDRVQIIKRQVWMVNYFLPLLQSHQLDYLGVFLIDPHNNLIRHSTVPFVELETDQVNFYSYPTKGLFHELKKHSQSQVEKIALSDEYFDQVIYNAGESKTLYSALGFAESSLLVSQLPSGRLSASDKLAVIPTKNSELLLEKAITLESQVYNWKTRERQPTSVVTLMAQKHLDIGFLTRIREKFGSDALALANGSTPVVSTLDGLTQPLTAIQGSVKIKGEVFHYQTHIYRNQWLDNDINLVVLSAGAPVEPDSSITYKSIVLTTVITILLGLMAWFYFKSSIFESGNRKQTETAETLAIQDFTVQPPDQSLKSNKDRFLLIEDKGKSQTIPLDDISHIRVTDHYCTVFYRQENQWNSWMIMERLKTFETRYQQLFIKINRSTLINPDRIDKIQLLQRKLTMEGEPDYLLTISQSSLDIIKSIVAAKSGH